MPDDLRTEASAARRRVLLSATALRAACSEGNARQAVRGAVDGWRQNAGKATLRTLLEMWRTYQVDDA